MGLPLAWPAPTGDGGFIVSDANRAAVRHFERPGAWPVMATLLTGPRLSGRSLLARAAAAKTGGRLFDGAESHDEEAIFHAWNHAQEVRRPLIIVADRPPPGWAVRLPDLASRLAATPQVSISEPDEPLFGALLDKLLRERGLVPPPELSRYLFPRVERSYLVIHRIVETLDRHLLSRRARLTIPSARRALEDAGIIDAARLTG